MNEKPADTSDNKTEHVQTFQLRKIIQLFEYKATLKLTQINISSGSAVLSTLMFTFSDSELNANSEFFKNYPSCQQCNFKLTQRC